MLKTLTRFPSRCWLSWQGVSVVVDYAKTKKFAKPFLSVHMGLRSNILSKKMDKKTRDTVPLILSAFISRWITILCLRYVCINTTLLKFFHHCNLRILSAKMFSTKSAETAALNNPDVYQRSATPPPPPAICKNVGYLTAKPALRRSDYIYKYIYSKWIYSLHMYVCSTK